MLSEVRAERAVNGRKMPITTRNMADETSSVAAQKDAMRNNLSHSDVLKTEWTEVGESEDERLVRRRRVGQARTSGGRLKNTSTLSIQGRSTLEHYRRLFLYAVIIRKPHKVMIFRSDVS